MALTVANVGRGNYVLGGLGRRQGPSAAEAMDLAQREEQRFRDAQRQARQTELSMQETRQAMQLRASEEARRQQQFEAAQAARAQAAARAAAQQAATQELIAGLRGVGAGGTGAPPAAGLTIAPQTRFTNDPTGMLTAPPAGAAPRAGLSFGTPVTGGAGTAALQGGSGADTLSPAGVRPRATRARSPAAPPAGAGIPMSAQPGALSPPAPTGGTPVLVDFGGVTFQVYPDGRITNTVTNTEIPLTEEFDALRSALVERAGIVPQGRQYRTAEAETLGERIRGGIGNALDRSAGVLSAAGSGLYGAASDVLGPVAAAAGATELAAALERQSDIAYNAALTNLRQGLSATAGLSAEDFDMEPATFRAAMRQAEATAATGVEPASPEAAAAEAPTTADEAAPTVTTPWGGLQLNFGTPVQLSFGETGGEGSRLYVAAPERIFQDAELAARQQQRLELLATFYEQTNNLEGLLGVMNQLDELAIEQRYLEGMTAIVGIQQQNFGPVQGILQQRFPGQQVEVRPYTDGTVEIFLDGEREARLSWDELATSLRDVYDRGFIEQQQAIAEEAASRSRFMFEEGFQQQAQAMREIAVARNQADIDRYENEGRIERIGETLSGEAVFQGLIGGLPVQFVYRETMSRDPQTGEEVPALIATPVDQRALAR